MWPVEYRVFAFRGTQDAPRARTDTDDPPATPIGLVTELFPHIIELGDMNCIEHNHWCATHKDACNKHERKIKQQKCRDEMNFDRYRYSNERWRSVQYDERYMILSKIRVHGWMQTLCRKVRRRELDQLTNLNLRGSGIDSTMLKMFMDAMTPTSTHHGWALENLKELDLSDNNISDLKPFARAITQGALPNLDTLDLTANGMRSPGLEQLTQLIANKELLVMLKNLDLSLTSLIDDTVIAAFASQIDSGALRSLKLLHIPGGSRMINMALGDACRKRNIQLYTYADIFRD